jgi:hypothetical protein
MLEPKYIYPEIKINTVVFDDGSVMMMIDTYLRKKDRKWFGKYYLWHFFRQVTIPKADDMNYNIAKCVAFFTAEIYRMIILEKIDKGLIYSGHISEFKKVFELDLNQIDEKKRLTLKLK